MNRGLKREKKKDRTITEKRINRGLKRERKKHTKEEQNKKGKENETKKTKGEARVTKA